MWQKGKVIYFKLILSRMFSTSRPIPARDAT
jgi:hypothetical protein